jgi:hypothetical protein
MIKKLISKLFPTKYVIVEVEAPLPNMKMDEDAVASIQTLSAHPGFQALCLKLRMQRHVLESKFKGERHASLRDADFLQSGIFWAGWLEQQVKMAVYKTERRREAEPTDDEVKAFREASALVELVGE